MQEAEPRSLVHCSVLEEVESRTIAGVGAASTWHSFEVGEQICVRGDAATDFIFLAEGSARVLIHAASGQEIAFADVEAGGISVNFRWLMVVNARQRLPRWLPV